MLKPSFYSALELLTINHILQGMHWVHITELSFPLQTLIMIPGMMEIVLKRTIVAGGIWTAYRYNKLLLDHYSHDNSIRSSLCQYTHM